MKNQFLSATAGVLLCTVLASTGADSKPYSSGQFHGRIAYSADGNHNDPDDWIASPVALAIFARAGLKDRLVHFDYNCILPETNAEWEKTHAESVLRAAELYGFDHRRFFNCRTNLDGAIASITTAVNQSSAENPLYFILAGPMEVPLRGIRNSDSRKRQYVYCISHSAWNDGYGRNYRYSFTKRSVIEQGIHWLQIRDQNAKLSFGQYGRLASPAEFAPYFWMRESTDPQVRFLWDRMLVSTRPDPSDAGMAWFLATGEEDCDPARLRALIERHQVPVPVPARQRIRLEAENFRSLVDCVVESRNDRTASHRLSVRVQSEAPARISTSFNEPFTEHEATYDIEIRYSAVSRVRLALFISDQPAGSPWESEGHADNWKSKHVRGVLVRAGDTIRLDAQGPGARIDYVQLTHR